MPSASDALEVVVVISVMLKWWTDREVGLVDMGCTEGDAERELSCLYEVERGFCLTTNVSTTLSSKETPKEEPLSPPMIVAQLPKRERVAHSPSPPCPGRDERKKMTA